MNQFKLKKMAVACVVLMGSAGVAWASCGFTEVMVSAAVVALTTTVTGEISAGAAEIVAQSQNQTNQIVSAISVLTKQKSISADKASQAMIQTGAAQAVFTTDLAQNELVSKLVLDYTSQGFDPCGQSVATKALAKSDSTVRSSIPGRVQTEVEGIGGKYGSKVDVLISRETQHNKLFCTQSEKEAGICSSVGRLPGGDTNAALLFSTDTSSDAVSARSSLINSIVGLPDEALPVSAQNSVEGQAYFLEKKKKDAFMGWAANSLKTIQAESEGLKAKWDDRIGQYFGTPRATLWASAQASQSSRGILVDLVKIEGLTLKSRERAIREKLRLEANFAALVELENQSVNGQDTQRAALQVATESALRKVSP